MDTVTAADGTEIAVEPGGDGPPLVLVHGTTSDRSAWDPVLPALRERFTVYAMDRRGRGDSGDADDYAIEREFEDVVAVCDAVEGSVALLGHSYGALCAMGAAPAVGDLHRLVLYEPPLRTDERPTTPAALLDRMEALVDAGDHEGVLETFFRDVARSGDRLERYRSQPSWERRLATAPTVPRENRAIGTYRPGPADFADVTAPTLVLLGSESGAVMAASTRAATELFADSELVVLEGAGHAAALTHPALLVEAVVDFLDQDGR